MAMEVAVAMCIALANAINIFAQRYVCATCRHSDSHQTVSVVLPLGGPLAPRLASPRAQCVSAVCCGSSPLRFQIMCITIYIRPPLQDIFGLFFFHLLLSDKNENK